MPRFNDRAIAELDEVFLSSGWSLIRDQVLAARRLLVVDGARDDQQLVSKQEIPIRNNSWSHIEILGNAAKEFEDKGHITRGDVIAKFTNVNAFGREKLAWAFMFGYGKVGYGPRRLEPVLNETALDDLLDKATSSLHRTGAVDAYQEMFKKVSGLGPAFFTKYLYFEHAANGSGAKPHALILDQVLASKMSAIACLAGRKAGIAQSHELANWLWQGPFWSSSRYRKYLNFMNAQDEMQADLLELLLFNPDLKL